MSAGQPINPDKTEKVGCEHRYEMGLGVMYCVLCGQDAPDQTCRGCGGQGCDSCDFAGSVSTGELHDEERG